jgi:uncharacterized coiled-coil protein SlyX
MTDVDSRLVDLELRFMKLERFTHELSDVVAEQRQQLDGLHAEIAEIAAMKRLKDRLAEGEGEREEEGQRPSDPSRDRPPHY